MGVGLLFVLWLSVYEYASSLRPVGDSAIAGLGLILAGICLRFISIRQLNRFFVSQVGLVRNHRLVTTGIYALVRHPSELGLLAICCGITLLLESKWGFGLFFLLLLPLTIYRISLEDNLLRSAFGMEFDRYRAATPGLLPKMPRCSTSRQNSAAVRPRRP